MVCLFYKKAPLQTFDWVLNTSSVERSLFALQWFGFINLILEKAFYFLDVRPTKSAPVRNASQNSVEKKPLTEDLNDDADSLDDYGEDTKFKEDGSFIGQYGGEDNKKLEGTILVQWEINQATYLG